MRQIAVLGSTGSIGTSCLEVIEGQRDQMSPVGITAHRRWEMLGKQSKTFAPRWAVVSDTSLQSQVDRSVFSSETELLFGPEAIEQIAADSEVDTVVSGIVGAAGLRGTWAAVEAGKRVAIANKETLVVAGPLVMELAKKTGAELLPVDSEHSAVFQALQSGRVEVPTNGTTESPCRYPDVKRVVLTASGGPFRGYSRDQLQNVTKEAALAHPTWDMGPKITIDSATMMNKALEVIEAKWLFGLRSDQIDVVVHPQSIVHSFVEFIDGSVIAQLSPPDMRLPIQYALTYPERRTGISPCLDWKQTMQLEFAPPDLEAFPALQLGLDVACRGGSSGAVLNAANEAAVARFLADDLKFIEIPEACQAVLEAHNFDPQPSLSELLQHDAWAREEIQKWKSLH